MAALIPMGLMAASAIPGFIGGIMDAIAAGKKLQGGRLIHNRICYKPRGGKIKHHRHRYVKHRKYQHHKKGKGVISDTLGALPLVGPLLGPLVRAFGGRLKKMPMRHKRKLLVHLHKLGRGLSPMYIRRPYAGAGLYPYGKIHGGGLSPMYIRRPYAGAGLLAPAGGVIVRKGHLRKIPGRKQKVRVKPTLIIGSGMHRHVKKKACRK